MKLRQLFENPDQGTTVGVCFGRWNPPHKGHAAAWETAAQFDHFYVGTNKNTQGPNDPLPYEVKLAAMQVIWPDVAGHVIPEQNLFTLCSRIYDKYGESANIKVCTDEDWLTGSLEKYNGKEGAHGYYKFASISQAPTPRLSSATALRSAVRQGDKELFSSAAGVSWDTPIVVDGRKKRFFDVVAHYLKQFPEKVKKAKKEVAEGFYEFFNAMEDAAGVGIITKQNSTCDVDSSTPQKNLDAFNLEESHMSELHAEIADHLETPLHAFRNKRINPEVMGEHCIKLAKLLAKKHKIDYHTMQELVNQYIDNELEGEEDLLEAKPAGKMKTSQADQSGRALVMRDAGGYDRIYHLHRIMMAAGMADGKTEKPVKMDASSWYEKYNTAHPFTDAEYKKIKSAFKTIPTEFEEIVKNPKSMEVPGTNTSSAVAKPKRNKYGV